MKKQFKNGITRQNIWIIIMVTTLAGIRITKRQKQALIVMLSAIEGAGSLKRLRCEYDKPNNIFQVVRLL